jgi:CSLREA domain-containing protein
MGKLKFYRSFGRRKRRPSLFDNSISNFLRMMDMHNGVFAMIYIQTLPLKLIYPIICCLIIFASILGPGFQEPLQAATFTVTKTNDSADGHCDSDCSLRESIIAANISPGPDSIILPEGTYVLSIAGIEEDQSFAGDLDITDDLNIMGSGATTTIVDGGGIDRVFQVDPSKSGITVGISGLTIQNGSAPNDATDINNNSGGGIHNKGSLTLTEVIVRNNNANFFSNGGGVGNSGFLELINSIVCNNAGYSGGGIGNTGTMKLSNSSVGNNVSIGAVGSGGGIFNEGEATLMNSTVNGNSATVGGGISNLNPGNLDIFTSTISGNTASFTLGGGIYNQSLLQITNSTISGNVAEVSGGGIYNKDLLAMANVTIAGNEAKTGQGGGVYNDSAAQIENSILADNSASGIGSNCRTGNNFTDFGYNMEDADTCALTGAGDIKNKAPLLGPLQDNGGPTFTHALLAGSPAIDAGNPDHCTGVNVVTLLTTDQRGYVRPVDGDGDGLAVCDIGAYEAQTILRRFGGMPWLPLLLE